MTEMTASVFLSQHSEYSTFFMGNCVCLFGFYGSLAHNVVKVVTLVFKCAELVGVIKEDLISI